MSDSLPVPWERFSRDPRDPRDPENARMRASDLDRDVVLQVLGEAYADGRLDREEYDERITAVTTTKTIGGLTPHLYDLVPPRPTPLPSIGLARATQEMLQQRAVQAYERRRRQALTGFVIPSLIVWMIWVVSGFAGPGWEANFHWPLFVMAGTGANLLRMTLQKQDLIDEERGQLERKQRKALEQGKDDLDG